ncbi:MAG: SulP family inorganic anion transporter [Alphaproteobacteria bacterium]|nr:SulP family inorganic anion transporter [Alphaproteobacteria bacterium]
MSSSHNGTARRTTRPWLFASLSGYAAHDLGRDVGAGLTLAAIAIPEQMATARLGGLPAEIGFLAFIAGAVAFAVLGASRFLSVGADSTITPIFAGSLVAWAAVGSPDYAGMAAALALGVGIILVIGGVFRLGWIADLLSVPVMTGFLAGISVHILVSQLPGLLGLSPGSGNLMQQVAGIVTKLGETNLYALALGLLALGVTLISERISARLPGALIALLLATGADLVLGLEGRGVTVLGTIPGTLPHLALPMVAPDNLLHLVPLALTIALVIMLQTAATTRSFVAAPGEAPSVDRDFIGVGAGSILAGLFGAFPVNSSPPRTAIVAETGGCSQIAGLVAAAIVLVLAAVGGGLLAHVPHAALAGVLLFIASRIFRIQLMATVYRRTRAEFSLILLTMIAIIVLPIETGVVTGIVLSLMHGMWTTTRAHPIEFEKVPGTSIWWAPSAKHKGETHPGVAVVAFQAPLSFLNAYAFKQGILDLIERRAEPARLVVLEASSIVAIDYTAAEILADLIRHCHGTGAICAIARLESVRAQEALERFGITELLGEDHFFHSVDEAIRALAPKS